MHIHDWLGIQRDDKIIFGKSLKRLSHRIGIPLLDWLPGLFRKFGSDCFDHRLLPFAAGWGILHGLRNRVTNLMWLPKITAGVIVWAQYVSYSPPGHGTRTIQPDRLVKWPGRLSMVERIGHNQSLVKELFCIGWSRGDLNTILTNVFEQRCLEFWPSLLTGQEKQGPGNAEEEILHVSRFRLQLKQLAQQRMVLVFHHWLLNRRREFTKLFLLTDRRRWSSKASEDKAGI